jgi:hypothetical protein
MDPPGCGSSSCRVRSCQWGGRGEGCIGGSVHPGLRREMVLRKTYRYSFSRWAARAISPTARFCHPGFARPAMLLDWCTQALQPMKFLEGIPAGFHLQILWRASRMMPVEWFTNTIAFGDIMLIGRGKSRHGLSHRWSDRSKSRGFRPIGSRRIRAVPGFRVVCERRVEHVGCSGSFF